MGNIRTRLTVQFMALVTVVLLLFSLGVYGFSRLYLQKRFFSRLQMLPGRLRMQVDTGRHGRMDAFIPAPVDDVLRILGAGCMRRKEYKNAQSEALQTHVAHGQRHTGSLNTRSR